MHTLLIIQLCILPCGRLCCTKELWWEHKLARWVSLFELHFNGNNAAKHLGWIEVGSERCIVFLYHGKAFPRQHLN